ncbi:MAG: hypothetical protein Tsb0020_09000 [Haliangiales bacterium]
MQSGTRVAGRYVIESLAGSGGMSTVYKARDRDGTTVALKILKLVASHQAARFVRETSLLSKLRHPAIVNYLDSGRLEETGQHFLVLEWLDGEDLHARLGEGRMSVADSLRLALRTADALGFAHEQGVVHRDVKPENIFLPDSSIDNAKLLDFGIARWANAIESLTRTGARFGTPAYMSPEQVRGDRNLDARADVFSLGCVMYECIAGEPAFAANDAMAVFGKILFDDAPRISSLWPEVPDAVEALVLRMLARDPADRPGSGDEVAAEIRKLWGHVTDAVPEGRGRPGAKQNTLTDLEQRLVSVVVATLDSSVDEPAAVIVDGVDGDGVGGVAGDGALGYTSLAAGGERNDTEVSLRAAPVAARGRVATSLGAGGAGPGGTWVEPQVPIELDPALRSELETLGARIGILRSGLLVAVFEHRSASMHSTAGDQVVNAARCALRLRRGFPEAPIALATGRAIVHRTRLVGEVIDQAVALLTPPDGHADGLGDGPGPVRIVLDEVSAGLVGNHFIVEPLAGGQMQLVDQRRAESRTHLLRHRSPFVGRNSELTTLVATLSECVEDHVARAVLVTGPAGFGKSRLGEEFVERARGLAKELGRELGEGGDGLDGAEGLEIWIAQGEPMRTGSPLYLFSSALRLATGAVESEPAADRREALRRRVDRYLSAEDARRVTLFLGELLGIPSSEDDDLQLRAARADPKLMGDQVRRACADLLDAASACHPLIIMLEDLHWGDRATIEVLDLAMRNLVERPLFILALGRPELREQFPEMWASHNITEIRMNRLSRRAAQRLVKAGLGKAATPAHVSALVERGDGNPFYLEELVRRVADGNETLPDTVMAMVQGRLGALDPEARRVLRAASVYGRTFWRGGVVALAGTSIPVSRWLDALLELELIAASPSSRFPDEEEYTFRHALIGEGAYAMLTEADRRLGHCLAGGWMEAVGESDARSLAEHFERGGAPERALPHYVRAAEDALDRSDFDTAVAMAERGGACGAAGATLGALKRVQMDERVWRGSPAEVVTLGSEIMALLPRGSRWWFDVAGEVAIAYGKREEIAQVEALAEDMLAVDEADGDSVGRQIAVAKVVQVLSACGKHERAAALLSMLEAELGALADADPIVAANVHFARAFHADTALSDPATVLVEIESCAACFEAVGDIRQACFHRTNIGYAKLELGLFADAESDLRSALSIAERMAIDLAANTARQNLALACAYQGYTEEARSLGQQACRWFEEREEATRELVVSRLHLALVRLCDEDFAGAAGDTQAGLALLSERASLRPFVLAARARSLLGQGQLAEGCEIAAQAWQLMNSLGSVERGEAFVRLVWIEALLASGDEQQAGLVACDAAEILRARASEISRLDWRESFLENIPVHVQTIALSRRWTS